MLVEMMAQDVTTLGDLVQGCRSVETQVKILQGGVSAQGGVVLKMCEFASESALMAIITKEHPSGR